jgi:hypothetical protein
MCSYNELIDQNQKWSLEVFPEKRLEKQNSFLILNTNYFRPIIFLTISLLESPDCDLISCE